MQATVESYQDLNVIRDVLADAKTIAIVGMSGSDAKASNMVACYLQDHGYRIIPINPRYAGQQLRGETVYASLRDVPHHIDLVDVFRPSAEVSGVVDDAIAIKADAIWTQIDIVDLEAADRASQAGLKVVVDKCTKVEHARSSATNTATP